MKQIKYKILLFLLVSFIAGSFLVQLSVIIRFFSTRNLNTGDFFSITPIVVFVASSTLLFLLIKNKYNFSAFAFIISLLVVTITKSFDAGADLPQAIIMYSLIIVMSGILLGRIYPLIVSSLVSVVLFLIFWLQKNFYIANNNDWRTMDMAYDDLFAMVILFILMSAISWLFTREINKSINKALSEEKKAVTLAEELQKERDGLEVKVEQRTKELRESQLRELTQMNNMAEFGKMSAGLLHDIKNPLTVIAMNLDSLKSTNDKEMLELVNKSLLAAKTAETIIKTSQKQISEKDDLQEFDLVAEIKNTLLLVEHRALKERIKVEFKKDMDELIIESYPGKISRILANLLMNAIDSFFETEKEDKRIKIGLIKDDDVVKIYVKDNGCGIGESKTKNIFKAGVSDKKIEGRMGLGLYGSKKIANEDLKGDLIFESKINIGTKFTLIIPYEE